MTASGRDWSGRVETTVSADTSITWLARAYTWRWCGFGPRRYRGVWFAEHVAFPGLWGEGQTRQEAANDLTLAIAHSRDLREPRSGW